MKFRQNQTVQLLGVGIPGVITIGIPGIFLPGFKIASPAYEVQWVDGTKDIRMEEELSAITALRFEE